MNNRMNKVALCLLLALTSGLTSCGYSIRTRFHDQSVVLSETPLEDGTPGSVRYQLFPGQGGAPSIHMTRTIEREVPYLGLDVVTIDEERAERLKVEPWKGVAIHRSRSGRPGERAGIARDDVILQVGDVQVTSMEQFRAVAAVLEPGVPVPMVVLSHGVENTVDVAPDSRKEFQSDVVKHDLIHEELVQRHTGLQVATIDPDLAERVFGAGQPVTIVSGVVTGSPAYMSGLRSGDRVQSCDGAVVTSGADLTTAVLERVNKTRGGKVVIGVDGPLGAHSADLRVLDSIEDSSDFDIPILMSYRSDIDSTRWSLLDFIFQWGGNYSGYYAPSPTRKPQHTSSLSLFPLGMFEFERGPTRSRTTLFWLITWSSRR